MRSATVNAIDEMIKEVTLQGRGAFMFTDYKAAKSAWIQAGQPEETFDQWWDEKFEDIPEDCL